MEITIAVIALIGSLLIIILLLVAPQLTLRILVIGIFIGAVAVFVYADGFPKGLIEGIAFGGFFSLLFRSIMRERLAEMMRARAWLTANSPSECKKCGTELTYHREPKNFHQILMGGWTCPSCGAESDAHLDVFKFR